MPEALVEADEEALDAELSAEVTFAEALLVRDASWDDKELADDPVAVARTELKDDALLATAESMDDSWDDSALLTEERALVRAEEAESEAEDAEDAELERLLVSTEEVVTVVESWAWVMSASGVRVTGP